MPKNTVPVEAHLLFCPQDVGAQLKAAQYIASVMPTHLFVCGVDNMISTGRVIHDRQSFYNEITGARPAYGAKPQIAVIPELGIKATLYGSRHAMIAERRGRHAVARRAIHESSKAGKEAEEVYPYFQLMMQLEGSEISVFSQSFIAKNNPMDSVYAANNKVSDAADMFLETQNGAEELEGTILEYREAVRRVSLGVQKNLVRSIKKLPNTHPMGRIAILLDNPALLPISQEAPFSRKVDTTIKAFEPPNQDPGIEPRLYPDETRMVFLRGNMEFGLEFPADDPRQPEFDKRCFAYIMMAAIMEKIGVHDSADIARNYTVIGNEIDLSTKSIALYERVKDLAVQVTATYGGLDITSPKYDELKSELDKDFVIKLGATLSSLR